MSRLLNSYTFKNDYISDIFLKFKTYDWNSDIKFQENLDIN